MIGSWTDWELTELGKEHAENIGKTLSSELKGKGYKIYSSDLIRAKQTVEPLARYLGIPIEINAKLREIGHGEAVGKTKEWARENQLKEWSETAFDVPQFPGGETWRVFWNRIIDVCNEIVADDSDNIIIASHGVTLSIWQSIWLGEGIRKFEYTGFAGGVSFYGITNDGKRIIHRLNDSSYMKG
jgi:probable phosphoglycerate mutase